MTFIKKLRFFCEDCGHLFVKPYDDPDIDETKCPKCGSEYVNHDLDRSVFANIGMPELDECDPENCRSCRFHCEMFSSDPDPKRE